MIIGLTGRKGSGKSTVARALLARDFVEVSFAAPIRYFTANILELSLEELEAVKEQKIDWLDGTTPRHIMQTLGTEWGRQMIHPEIWIRLLKRTVDAALARGGANVVVSDIRFDNEAKMLREMGATIVRVDRPGTRIDDHPSEAGVSSRLVDFIVSNAGQLDAIGDLADLIIEKAK